MSSCPLSSCPACRLSYAIRRAATTKAVAASLVLWLIALALINGRPFGLAQLQEITGGPTILDMSFTTGPESVYAILDALGEAGRAFDLTHIVPLDLVFPFTYALFLALGISWGLSRLLADDSPWLLLNLAPVFAAAADYSENAGVITLLLTYPARLDPVAWFVSATYVIKFAFSAVSFITLFAALAGCAVVYLLRRTGRSNA
ncbi:MAG TPA: hypothetical protein VLL74_04205 [Methanoregula sp.]|nr:hypothetical protein [Methanoregula sp.]